VLVQRYDCVRREKGEKSAAWRNVWLSLPVICLYACVCVALLALLSLSFETDAPASVSAVSCEEVQRQ
jgi:hypothetical protein